MADPVTPGGSNTCIVVLVVDACCIYTDIIFKDGFFMGLS